MASLSGHLTSVGMLFAAVGMARSYRLVQVACDAHPQETHRLLERLGFLKKSYDGSVLVAAYQYAVLRKPFPEMNGTLLERYRNQLFVCYVSWLVGSVLLLVGFGVEIFEARANVL